MNHRPGIASPNSPSCKDHGERITGKITTVNKRKRMAKLLFVGTLFEKKSHTERLEMGNGFSTKNKGVGNQKRLNHIE